MYEELTAEQLGLLILERVRQLRQVDQPVHLTDLDTGPGATIDELIDDIDRVLDEHRRKP